jgi:MOSC domain-containing protein YiiM
MGVVEQVSISQGGLPKRAISEGLITPLGVEGDRHRHPRYHGGVRKAVLVVSMENIEALQGQGYPLFAGAMGENLTARGLDLRALGPGTRLVAGEALLEVTEARRPCNQLEVYGKMLGAAIFDSRVKAGDSLSPLWGMSGLYCAVVRGGRVRPRDTIEVAAIAK